MTCACDTTPGTLDDTQALKDQLTDILVFCPMLPCPEALRTKGLFLGQPGLHHSPFLGSVYSLVACGLLAAFSGHQSALPTCICYFNQHAFSRLMLSLDTV